MKNALMIFVVAVVVAGCATGPRQPTRSERAVQASHNSYYLAMQSIKRFVNTEPVDCNSSSMLSASNSLSTIEWRASSFYSVLSGGGRYSYLQKRDASEALNVLNPMAIKARFLMADAYLALGCLDQADATYRDIQIRYSGSSFASVRERALLGITDIRS